MNDRDTIAAIATPPGEGGIGVVRLSGPAAAMIAARLFRGAGGADAAGFASHTAHYGWAVEPETAERIDECVLTLFRAPRSYTGEDVAELACHGSNVGLGRVLSAARRAGARLAEPGEFTRRAFLNGRIDLARAEAVADLIRARTDAALRVAARQLEGRLSRAIRDLRATLIGLLAEIEATIDFPDDVEPPEHDDVAARLRATREGASALLATANAGRIYREGAGVVIVGRPNVGKSSLLNALLGESRAIVTEIPGTTRDVIEELVSIRGIPIRAIDTAGLRATDDRVEQIGVGRSREQLAAADLALVVVDASAGLTPADRDILAEAGGGPVADRRAILVANKCDLGDRLADLPPGLPVVRAVAPRGEGIDELEAAIAEALVGAATADAAADTILVSNARHQARLEAAIAALRDAEAALAAGFDLDLLATDVKIAAEALGEITGESVTEETITQIFARFCVGK
jgi:tRNA modification GTPase